MQKQHPYLSFLYKRKKMNDILIKLYTDLVQVEQARSIQTQQ